ncbi:uncharacterized protein DSM5745_08772 [Aspergillus mulundensis]|uniref:Uncharacterized protein n=1 Tax=Aspergillus mulundensis TaxID=1810919 RepID=A0A3D8R4L8_9EURO|nr:hypothetical protein DSM5745_08772 [Aspergillus mulundensis]RDW69012.1 hypothetical protein DSM5745_08772 [Aspergillus mulundensis]
MGLNRDVAISLYFAILGSAIFLGTSIFLAGGYKHIVAFILTRRHPRGRRNADPDLESNAVKLQGLAYHRQLRHRLHNRPRPSSERFPSHEERTSAQLYDSYLS